jgi:peptidoglycan/xylan/chitin deacetylase (PgdA/CDA1 family)
VAITFDDDLETHWDVAAKLLREQGIPATFFLSGSFLSRPKPFWWEDLQRAVDEGTVEHHHLPELRPEELDDALLRKPGAIHKLAARFEQLEPARKRVVAGRLERLRSEPAGPAISVADVRALARDGFEIGFHTRDHEFLPNLTASEVQSGLVEGRDGLEAAAERPVDLLAYPHGGADRRVADAVRRAGYRGAYTVRAEPVLPTSGAHLLPRWEPPFRSDGTFRLALAQTLFLGPRP